jgi:hypothetical protein
MIEEREEQLHTEGPRPLRPRYRPFHYPITNAKKWDDERDIWQLLSPDVAASLQAKRALAEQLKQERQMSDSESRLSYSEAS